MGVLSAFGIGAIVGGVAVRVLVEEKIAKEYDESLASVTRAYETSLNQIQNEEGYVHFSDIQVEDRSANFGQRVVWDAKEKDEYVKQANVYHTPVVEDTTPVNVFVEGTPNQFGISYIEEEEFDEEDGRQKYSISMVIDPETMDVTFFCNGVEMGDWGVRLGPSIVTDFIEHVPHNLPNQILYVRNHQTDEDYEVVRELP